MGMMFADTGPPFAPTDSNHVALKNFFLRVADAPLSALLLDFDGTLAPFRVDPAAVRPWAGVRELLDRIRRTERTHVAIVSGRPAHQVATQLDLETPVEIWGLHGAERLLPSGLVEHQELPRELTEGLRAARQAIGDLDISLRLEDKWNALVVHWRGAARGFAALAETRTGEILTPFAELPGMSLLLFDGGIELRAGRDKGDAVRVLVESLPPGAPAAYLGDDATDEDAFEAIGDEGLSVLVRRAWRPTLAQVWVRPPAGLRAFLERWYRAVR